jgi:predicted lipoprotein
MILLNKDEKLAEPGALAKQSAAVQGLPALEVLIRDKDVPLGPEEPARFRCLLAGAVARNLVRLTDEVVEEWEKPGGWKDKMLNPGPDNDTYKSASESAVEVVKAFLVGLSLTADLQLKPQVDPKIRLAPPYNKSGLQKQIYAASIASLHQLYQALQLEAYLKPEMAWMKNWSQGTWRTIESIDGAGGRSPHAQRKDTPTSREVFDRMNGLRNIVANRLSIAAGLTIGFNELDGD